MEESPTLHLTVWLHMESVSGALFVSSDGIRSHAVWLHPRHITAPERRPLNSEIQIIIPEKLARQHQLIRD